MHNTSFMTIATSTRPTRLQACASQPLPTPPLGACALASGWGGTWRYVTVEQKPSSGTEPQHRPPEGQK
ncbi:hypothetical protein M3J09_012383 [Ascochyta lentis]